MINIREYWKSMNDGMFRDYRPFYEETVLPFLINRKNVKIAELGVSEGISGIYLAEGMLNAGKTDFRIHMIDDLSYGQEHQMRQIAHHITQSGVKDFINAIFKDSLLASLMFEDGELDFVYIDSSHIYEPTKAEIRLWMPKITSGGMIAGHDYFNKARRLNDAVDELIPNVNTYPGVDGYGVWWKVLPDRDHVGQ